MHKDLMLATPGKLHRVSHVMTIIVVAHARYEVIKATSDAATHATNIVQAPHIAIMISSSVDGLGDRTMETSAVRRSDCHLGRSVSKIDAISSSPKQVWKEQRA
jgi:hypothetical protein